jgi:hypothetical protein
MGAIKYIFFYYISMGLLPILFDKMSLNRNPQSPRKNIIKHSNTGFSDKEIPFKLYTKSMIIGGINPKASEQLEFLIRPESGMDEGGSLVGNSLIEGGDSLTNN